MPHIQSLVICSCLSLHLAAAITATLLISDPETITSGNGYFKLGFFSPPNATFRYLGIWYNTASATDFIWVANRDKPLNDSSGVLRLSEDGNLRALNGRNEVVWSSNVSKMSPGASRKVQLLDSGSFSLLEFDAESTGSANGTVVWQSCDHPTDSVLPYLKLSMTSSNMRYALQSWKSPSDPSSGRFSLGTDSLAHPQIFIWDNGRPHWRTGPWNGNIFLGLLYTNVPNDYANTHMQPNNGDGSVKLFYTGISKLEFSHYGLSPDGSINEIWWDSDRRAWQTVYSAPSDVCDFYGKCGAFGTCNSSKSRVCRCLKGFGPRDQGGWSRGNWSGGCVRRSPLQCGVQGADEDGFFVLSNVKVPDLAEWSVGLNQVECRSECLRNCSCLAYAYDVGAGCMYWSRELIDIQELSSDGVDLYIRLPASELGNKQKPTLVIAVAVTLGAASIVVFLCFLWRRKRKRKEKRSGVKTQALSSRMYKDSRSQELACELPLLESETLAAATNNFDESHKLGQGGFGQVYKGKLRDGQEIAVKRLSTASGQGSEEFLNEIVVISKLQHRNFVRLVGFCSEDEEKMLVYEYMPNKSLDAYLFDPTKRKLLDWRKRSNIIEGICRGLIYLHRDSRLRIIHRDLKASNILLDEDLNPKISDFGMARIFGNNQNQVETRRVVRTYGYMSPEYAMEGHVSEKSDVYSFGVLVLEILTGEKNNVFWVEEQSLTLLGYVWKLWVDNDVFSAIDPVIHDPVFREEIKRCIQVGLLCVQEYVKDRPNMCTVMSMLSSEVVELPWPKRPGFCKRLTSAPETASSQLHPSCSTSTGNLSISYISGR